MKIPLLRTDPQRAAFESIVGRIQIILWLDHRTGVLDPDLSWDCETIEYVSGVMQDAGLKPGVAVPHRTGRGPETPCRVRRRRTISCKPPDDPCDRTRFVLLAGTSGVRSGGSHARAARRRTGQATRISIGESEVGIGHVAFDQALIWNRPEDLPPPDPDDPYPCNFTRDEFNDAGGWSAVNVPLEWLGGMTPGVRHEEEAAVRIAQLEQEVNDLRAMRERLIAGSFTEVGPMDVTVREAQRLLLRTGVRARSVCAPSRPGRREDSSHVRARRAEWPQDLPGRRSVLELRRRPGHRPRGHAG